MATSKPSAHLKEKAASAHPPARKPLNRSSSDTTSKAAKTLTHSASTAAATASKSRLPARKPVEKPPSPSRQPLKPTSVTTPAKEKAAKSSSTVSRAASFSSKPAAGSSEKTAKTLRAGVTQSSARAKSPGSGVIPRRKEPDASAPKTGEESFAAAEKDPKAAEIHVKENDSVSAASSDDHVSDEHSHDAIEQKAEEVTEPDEVIEEEKIEKVVEAGNDKSAAEEKAEQDEPNSPKQEPDGTVDDNGDLDHEEMLAAEITEAPRGQEPCEIQKMEPEVEEHKEHTGNDHNNPSKTEVISEEVENKPEEVKEAPAVDPSSNEHAPEKIGAEAAESKTAETEQDTSSATEASTSAEVVPEKKTVDEEKLGGVLAFRKPAVVQAKKKEAVPNNDVIEETRSKLLEKKRSKVRALVGAFETVMSLQDEGGQGQDSSSAKESTE